METITQKTSNIDVIVNILVTLLCWSPFIGWTLLQAYWFYGAQAPMTHGSIVMSLLFAIMMDLLEVFSVGLFLFLA